MSRMIKQKLKKHHCLPEAATNTLETVIKQCESWKGNEQENYSNHTAKMYEIYDDDIPVAAEL